MYVSGRIFRCISGINRVRRFQGTFQVPGGKAEGLSKKGLAREDRDWCRGRSHLSGQDRAWYQLKSHQSQWCPRCQQPHASPTAGAGQVDRGNSLETKPHLPELEDRQVCSDKHFNTHTLHRFQDVHANTSFSQDFNYFSFIKLLLLVYSLPSSWLHFRAIPAHTARVFLRHKNGLGGKKSLNNVIILMEDK